ncbi:MAG: hypothetical protein AB8G95_18440 [Anaerolineae bacterium]
MSKVKEQEVAPNVPDIFLETLRKTLEHIADVLWLEKNSPLTSVFFANPAIESTQMSQLQLLDRPDVDDKLRLIWRDWEDVAKTPLQALIWDTIGQLAGDVDDQFQAVLLLTYFDLDQPKQSQVIKTLAVGRSTYYRYLDRAVETLGYEIVKNLRPALRLEQPQARPLVGRESETASALGQLRNGNVVHLVGGSGLGKTSLGAALASQWEHAVFWYTFRPQLTDSFEQLLFALAFFLHEQGLSNLWLYLSSHEGAIQPDRALMMLSQHLDELQATPPLFCFDEVDILLPDDLNDSETHIQLRGFLTEWANLDRKGSPILNMGQRILFEPESDCLFALSQLNKADFQYVLQSMSLDPNLIDVKKLHQLTRGNPLLLRFFAILHQQGFSVLESSSADILPSAISLDWFWQNLRQRLNETESALLREVAIFPGNAPKDVWRKHRKLVEKMISIGILEEASGDTIGLHPALRSLIYKQTPFAVRAEMHCGVGHLLAERSYFTQAAYHFIEGGRPEFAIWTWYTHRQSEIEQGQAGTALQFFNGLARTSLPHPADHKALALLIAQLSSLSGSFDSGLAALEATTWSNGSVSSALAHEYRGVLLSEMGDTELSLSEYRKSLEAIENLRSTQEIYLRTHIARRTHTLLADIGQATTEAQLAKFDLDILQGQLADAAGDYSSARLHYANALAVAEQVTNPSRLAKLHEALGVMEARYGHVEAAVDHFKKSGQYHHACGNLVYAKGLTNTNISFTYLAKRRYEDAYEPGKDAHEFYFGIQQPYWLAINEANLAEITFYLSHYAESRHYAESGLRREEPSVRPYCLYILGHLSRVEKDFSAAAEFCHAAIKSAMENEDPWAEAPARNALGELLRDQGEQAAAAHAHGEALAIWEKIGIQHEVDYTQQLMDQLQEAI